MGEFVSRLGSCPLQFVFCFMACMLAYHVEINNCKKCNVLYLYRPKAMDHVRTPGKQQSLYSFNAKYRYKLLNFFDA